MDGPDRSTAKPSRRFRRGADRITLKRKDELARISVERARLALQRDQDAYASELEDKADTKKRQRRSASLQAIRSTLRSTKERLADDRPLLAALVVSGLCLVTTFAGQVMVYGALNWHGFGWIGYILPAIVEGSTWTFAIFGAWLAAKGLAYSTHIRFMWLFAFYAAASNTYHFAVNLGDAITGVLLGGASVVGPFIWHRYVHLRQVARTGRTAAQIKAALLQKLFHPVLSWRATGLWAAAGGTLPREAAWRLTWLAAKGTPPGVAPTAATGAATSQATPQVTPTEGDDGTTDAATYEVTDEVLRTLLEEWSGNPDTPGTATSTATAVIDDRPISELVAQPRPPVARAPRTATANGVAEPADGTAAAKVADYYRTQREAGVRPQKVSPTEAARVAGCSRQNAAKVLARLRAAEKGRRS